MVTINKKTMLIGWTIGLGSGLFISGIILSILLYSSNKFEAKQRVPTSTENIEIENVAPNENIKDENIKDIEVVKNKESKDTQKIKDETEDEIAEEIIDEIEEVIVEPQTIEVQITATATAKQIAKILEEKGVISDSEEFLTYVISKNITRGLGHGKKIFNLNSDNESALKVLTSSE